jgi:hypothetical protein
VVGFDGTNYLVAWHGATGGIHATRVSKAGTVLDSTALTISPTGWNAAVAYGGGSYLVVWNAAGIVGSRVGTDGSVLDPAGVTISPSAHNGAEPAIAFDGTNYLVAWDDIRNDPWGDIFTARVSPAGTVLDPSGIAVAADSSPAGLAQREPSVAATVPSWSRGATIAVSESVPAGPTSSQHESTATVRSSTRRASHSPIRQRMTASPRLHPEQAAPGRCYTAASRGKRHTAPTACSN